MKTNTQISFAVTAKLISAFVFATQIVQSYYFLNTQFQASSHLLWLYSLVSVGSGRKPECWFSHDTAHICLLFEIQSTKRQVSCQRQKLVHPQSLIWVFTRYLWRGQGHMSHVMKKTTFWFPTLSDTQS